MKTPATNFPAVLALAAALAGTLSACVSVPPEPHAVELPDLGRAELAADLHLPTGDWPGDRWWTRYGDAQLDALVDRALQGSPSLEAAAARVHAAQSAVTVSRAAAGAEAGVTADANRQRYSANGLFPAPIGGATFNDFNVKLQARYDFDLWGRHRAEVAAAVGEEAARRAEQAQVRQQLAGAVVQAYAELQSDWSLADKLRQALAAQQALADDRERRASHGLATADDVRAEQARAAVLRGRIAEVQAHALGQREALRALAATCSEGLDLKPQAMGSTPQALPAHLGYELLARRADLQAARWRVEAAMGRVDAAKAAFYPEINLAASLGLDSLTLPHLLETGSRTFLLGPSLALPLFSTGTLKGQLGGARASRDELIATYDQRVLDAVREVAQASAALQGLAEQSRAQQDAATLTEAQRRSSQARLRQGLADHASALQADLAVLREDQNALQLQRQRLQAEVALTQALGGGFKAQN